MLILPIKKKWFDMIYQGIKTEEYREIKPYYDSRLLSYFHMKWENSELIEDPFPFSDDDWYQREVMFRNGYSGNSPNFKVICSLKVATGRAEWGAEENVKYYVLVIHKIGVLENGKEQQTNQ